MKTKYSKERAEKIIKLLEDGNYCQTAAHASGICEDTFYTWIKKHPEFAESVKKAKAKAEADNVKMIQTAAKEPKTWQAAAWWLERTNWKKWGRKDRLDVESEGGIKIEFVNKTKRETKK
jgi:transposase